MYIVTHKGVEGGIIHHHFHKVKRYRGAFEEPLSMKQHHASVTQIYP